jgi:cell wall-associated NlpC family hydrolase
MFVQKSLQSALLALAIGILVAPAVRADEDTQAPAISHESMPEESPLLQSKTLLQRATAASISTIESTLDDALDLIGIRYRRGGTSPEKGFDCSGFVSHVFREGLGLYLPHSAKAMSGSGEKVTKTELKPGDLVFFNTMRRTFSHVGIYLGDSLFVHAPRAGGRVRVEDMSQRYWVKRFNGARRIAMQ